MSFGPGKRPDGTSRRSQMLMTAGPGALVDLIHDAVVVGGLDAWRYKDESADYIVEPHLQAKALRMLRKIGWSHPQLRLRAPPSCADDEASPRVGVLVARFPGWYLCQEPKCRSLVHWKGLNERKRHNCTTASGGRGQPVVPIRFVGACQNGHLQDIDWAWYVHRGKTQEGIEQTPGTPHRYCVRDGDSKRPNDPLGTDWQTDLYLTQVGTSGELTDYIAGCRACGLVRGLQELMVPEAMGKCTGQRPWLGFGGREPCDQMVRTLTRTASNSWFPQSTSALSIPDPAGELRKAVERVWHIVQTAKEEQLPIFRGIPQVGRELNGYSDAEVWAELDRRQKGLPVPELATREIEWRALMAAPEEKPGDRPPPNTQWYARRLPLELPPFLERVVLVHQLREVRALLGFTRIDDVPRDAEGEYDLDVRTAPLALDTPWIPASEMLGEGIFLSFELKQIQVWEAQPRVKARAERFRQALFAANEGRRVQTPFYGVRLYMLHSLAHLLINSISLECGYPATSIRERIYCSEGQPPRAGILLYTGSPGSEGTLGGLIEVGRDILKHLRRAAESGLLCSNDPVCAQHDPADAQQGRHREGAACHGCLLIGEPSCERQNQDLDRALVVPTLEEPDLAFLKDWLA